MTTSLDYLKQTGTVVVSDSGDFECECYRIHPPFPVPSCNPNLHTRTPFSLHKHQCECLIPDTAIDVYKPQVDIHIRSAFSMKADHNDR